jgi:hypothetical protein
MGSDGGLPDPGVDPNLSLDEADGAGPWCRTCGRVSVKADGEICTICAALEDTDPQAPAPSVEAVRAAGIAEELKTPLTCPHCSETIEGVEIPNFVGGHDLDDLEFDLGGYEDEASSPPHTEKLIEMLGKHFEASASTPACGGHHFERLHKDDTHAVIFCSSCGLMRVVEMALTEDGKMPLLDIPTPIMLDPGKWPELGSGVGRVSRQRDADVLLNRVVSLLQNRQDELGLPMPKEFETLWRDIEDYRESGEE